MKDQVSRREGIRNRGPASHSAPFSLARQLDRKGERDTSCWREYGKCGARASELVHTEPMTRPSNGPAATVDRMRPLRRADRCNGPFPTKPHQETPLEQFGASRSVLARRCSRDTATLVGWITCASTPARLEPAGQPEAVAAGFEGQRNPRDRAASPDRLILPAMQQDNQPFWARLLLPAWLTLNPGKHAANQPARVAQLDDGNNRAILVFWSRANEGSA